MARSLNPKPEPPGARTWVSRTSPVARFEPEDRRDPVLGAVPPLVEVGRGPDRPQPSPRRIRRQPDRRHRYATDGERRERCRHPVSDGEHRAGPHAADEEPPGARIVGDPLRCEVNVTHPKRPLAVVDRREQRIERDDNASNSGSPRRLAKSPSCPAPKSTPRASNVRSSPRASARWPFSAYPQARSYRAATACGSASTTARWRVTNVGQSLRPYAAVAVSGQSTTVGADRSARFGPPRRRAADPPAARTRTGPEGRTRPTVARSPRDLHRRGSDGGCAMRVRRAAMAIGAAAILGSCRIDAEVGRRRSRLRRATRPGGATPRASSTCTRTRQLSNRAGGGVAVAGARRLRVRRPGGGALPRRAPVGLRGVRHHGDAAGTVSQGVALRSDGRRDLRHECSAALTGPRVCYRFPWVGCCGGCSGLPRGAVMSRGRAPCPWRRSDRCWRSVTPSNGIGSRRCSGAVRSPRCTASVTSSSTRSTPSRS